ncbi:S-layer homology domain-containing protein [Actinomarinicola tropica]|uniref:S-layer homology domain-containing protein n=1 Tax=Actinomarinicola tropica TaxID=2789776 RepID=A0A5Q2RTB7_9ACTN|nr:S-layer homology domain-containing protein [Actinomarinicola tropica]QGG96455.1 hypothetical protein GH723_15850 [Actinomarinicola tropica]
MRRTTAALVLALIVSLLAAAPASSQTAGTEIGGTLGSGTTVWTPDHSPYVLTADVIVPPDGHLYIAPGTTVTSEADHQLLVNGSIRTDGATFDLPAGIVVDSTATPPAFDQAELFTTTFRGATGAAIHVERGTVVPVFATFEDNATAITGGPDAGTIWLNFGVVRDTDTLAVVEGHVIVTAAHLSGFERGVVAESMFFHSNVVEPPSGPCTADGTGCALAVSGPAEDAYAELHGSWFGTDDPTAMASMIWDGQDQPGVVTFDLDQAYTESFDVEPPVVTVTDPGPTEPAVGGQLSGLADDLPDPGGNGVGSTSLWLYDATDGTAWDGYEEQWVPIDGSQLEPVSFPAVTAPVGGGISWSAELPPLAPGHDYVAVAFATEMGIAGSIGVSEPVFFRAVADPAAPTITAATPNPDGTVTVSWDPPDDTGGLPIDSYDLVCTPDPQPPVGDLETVERATTATSATFEPAIGVRYTCTVTATTTAGTSPTSAPRTVRVPAGAPTFSDTPGGTFFTAAVGWAQAAGLTTGVGGTDQFQPHRAITRAEVITLLWRHAGSPSGAPAHGFDDTTPGAFYDRALSWARNDGLTTGVGGTNQFQPDRPITRAETITLLWRYAGSPGGAPAHGFDDTTPGAFYDRALSWARNDSLTTGVGGTNQFQPDRPITRAETITLLHRAATN